MIISILDWLGTIFIILGGFTITSKKASNPKIRILALIFYFVSVFTWIPFSILIGTPGLFFTQLVFLGINAKGLYYCIREIKITH